MYSFIQDLTTYIWTPFSVSLKGTVKKRKKMMVTIRTTLLTQYTVLNTVKNHYTMDETVHSTYRSVTKK